MLWLKSESMIRPSTMMEMHALAPKKYLMTSSFVRPGITERPRVEIASFRGALVDPADFRGFRHGIRGDNLAEKTR